MSIYFAAFIAVASQLHIAVGSIGKLFACLESLTVESLGLEGATLALHGLYVQSFIHQVYILYKDWTVNNDWHGHITRITIHNGLTGGRRRFLVTHLQSENRFDDQHIFQHGYG